MTFYLTHRRLAGFDLDRMVIPVLDTMFSSRHVQGDPSLTGALFDDVDDAAVVRLEARKLLAEHEADEGVDVTVGWTAGEP